MSGPDDIATGSAVLAPRDSKSGAPLRATPAVFGTIVVIGGGCYGSYYVRQLGRARAAGAVTWRSLVVVDRDPRCRVASATPALAGVDFVAAEWDEYLVGFLAPRAAEPNSDAGDAIVPSPLMPHLLFEWLVSRARARFPQRVVAVRSLGPEPDVPWQRSAPDGSTHYVSYAEWMCPVNCIEPARCPATRGPREWSMPSAVHAYVARERVTGHVLEGPFVFHCTHRAFGVGMIDVRDVISADRRIEEVAARGPADFLVGTVSHCHGALSVLSISA